VEWTKRTDRQAILYYENMTGKLDWTPAEVAKWLQENTSIEMPTARTPLEILTERLARAAGSALDRDPGASVDHRVHLAYRTMVEGEMQMRWVDMDSPALTSEKLMDSTRLRRDQALNILVRVAADYDHASKAHPDWNLVRPDNDLTDEVTWALNAPAKDGAERKAG
jgi:hypothetical protein